MEVCLLPHIFLAYCVISGFVGFSFISFFITGALVLLLELYKLPKGSTAAAERILQPSSPHIIAHRGSAHDSPENTLGAIRQAKADGAVGVEFDVEFSSDGVPVVLHDDTLDRTTDGNGLVSSYTFAELQELSASAKHPLKDKFPGEKIPSLDAALKLCLDLGLKIYIDVKGNASKAPGTIVAMFQKYPQLYDNAILCSFWPQVPYMVRKLDPRIITGLTHRHRVLTRKVDGTERSGPFYKQLAYPVLDIVLEWSMHTWLPYFCGNSAFLVFLGDVSPKIINSFRERGVHVVVWTANSPHEKRYIRESLKCSYMTDSMSNEGCGPQKN